MLTITQHICSMKNKSTKYIQIRTKSKLCTKYTQINTKNLGYAQWNAPSVTKPNPVQIQNLKKTDNMADYRPETGLINFWKLPKAVRSLRCCKISNDIAVFTFVFKLATMLGQFHCTIENVCATRRPTVIWLSLLHSVLTLLLVVLLLIIYRHIRVQITEISSQSQLLAAVCSAVWVQQCWVQQLVTSMALVFHQRPQYHFNKL